MRSRNERNGTLRQFTNIAEVAQEDYHLLLLITGSEATDNQLCELDLRRLGVSTRYAVLGNLRVTIGSQPTRFFASSSFYKTIDSQPMHRAHKTMELSTSNLISLLEVMSHADVLMITE
jgi:hypothetical protein